MIDEVLIGRDFRLPDESQTLIILVQGIIAFLFELRRIYIVPVAKRREVRVSFAVAKH